MSAEYPTSIETTEDSPPLRVPVRLLAYDEEQDDIGDEVLFEGHIPLDLIPERMWAYQTVGVPDLIQFNGWLFRFCGDGCTSDTGGYLSYDEVFACTPPESTGTRPWPDTASLSMPRQDNGTAPDPVLDALLLIAQPWLLQGLAHSLRKRGMPIPKRAEAEFAAAPHWLIGHALRAGANWREAADAELEATKPPAVAP